MATFTYFYRMRIDTQKFPNWEDLRAVLLAESQAGSRAIAAGALQCWKDVAEPVVYAILTTEADDPIAAHGKMLKLFSRVPLAANGALIIEEGRAVAPYQQWADYLASAS